MSAAIPLLSPYAFMRCTGTTLLLLIQDSTNQMDNIIMRNLQLKYYNSNMFRPSLGHLQGVRINLCIKHRFYVNKLG
jgi:hypothetical protein